MYNAGMNEKPTSPAQRFEIDEICELCGSDGAEEGLSYTEDGRCLVCSSCRDKYEAEGR
jgi:hypothetical protein